jgi:hypothetical protein
MGIIKELARKKKLQSRKESKTKLKELTQKVNEMPKCCGTCGANFDGKKSEHLDNWRVMVLNEGTVIFTCSECLKV